MNPLPKSHIIVVGNEKGGTGKSTVAMHLAVGLMGIGYTVACFDLDGGQGTLTRFLANRRSFGFTIGQALPAPEIESLIDPGEPLAATDLLASALARHEGRHDVILMDSPGSSASLGSIGHGYADTLITPMNDSFVDLDVMARVDPQTNRIVSPSHYAATVWEAKKHHALRGGRGLDWVVMRNRMSPLDSRNMRQMDYVLGELARRIGFRLARGLTERVVYRELFLKGLTLLDDFDADGQPKGEKAAALSNVAARQEVRTLIATLRLPHPAPRPGAVPAATEPPRPLAEFRLESTFDNAGANADMGSWTSLLGDDGSHG